MTKLLATFMLAMTFMSMSAQAHGEEKPGPNGGEIRMPGGFHTEVKQRGRQFEVFLLDISFANPQTTDSSVELQALKPDSAAPIEIACRTTRAARPPHFVCLNPKYKPANDDVLKLKAKRGDAVGTEVEYKLPLLKVPVATMNGRGKSDGKKPASTQGSPAEGAAKKSDNRINEKSTEVHGEHEN